MEVNRGYKDSVFTLLFNNEERLLELYNAIEGTSYTDAADIKINTLQDIIFLDKVNDVSFEFRKKQIVLIEHQSTINPNMALRLLMYIGRLYEKIMDSKLLYSRKKTNIPRPEFIVLYNGREELPDESVLKLSELFEKVEGNDKIELELEVKVYNINKGRNPAIEGRCESLNGYAELVAKARENEKAGMDKAEAVKEAVKHCIREGTLGGFLREHGSEVENMLLTEWNWDDALQVCREESWEDGWEKGIVKGMEKGLLTGKLEIAQKMKSLNMPLEQITKYTGLNPDEIEPR
ncbi:MAG: Rpn family recombination-promoting nuclease/putative transposase [Spirochaetaceae bacterium]|jgi:hypothetical protein|nr:Rpn family recombination-promoting nuclease/putative transposase [Spirochaetaceae bacterium]